MLRATIKSSTTMPAASASVTSSSSLIGYKLYIDGMCPYSLRTLILLKILNLTCEVEVINASHKPAHFTEIAGTEGVPFLVIAQPGEKQTTVSDTIEICNQLCAKAHETRVLEVDDTDSLSSVVKTINANTFFITLPADHQRYRDATSDNDLRDLNAALDELEEALSDHKPYFHGDNISMIDIACAPAFYRLHCLKEDYEIDLLSDHSKLDAWSQRVCDDPCVREVLDKGYIVEFENTYSEQLHALLEHNDSPIHQQGRTLRR